MGTRIEVTQQLKTVYHRARKAEKSDILDTFCGSTGLCRSSARRYLTSQTAGRKDVLPAGRRKSRPGKYSTAVREKLVWLWRVMCMPCGKYLAVDRAQWIRSLEAHGELMLHQNGWTENVREKLLSMSAATVDRYLKPERDRLRLKGISATKPGTLLRNSIKIRKAGDEIESEPGFFEVDTVAHCGPTLQGEFARTLTMTDVVTGWIHLEAMRNNAHVHIRSALDAAVDNIPCQVQGLDCDNGSELVNYDVVNWAAGKQIFFTRARPYKKNDQAHVETKNNHVVRRFGFYFRYDTQEEREALSALWKRGCPKMNFFTATKKPTGWASDGAGRRTRVYDRPQTPLTRLLAAGVLSDEQTAELIRLRDSINPAKLTREIASLQNNLTDLAKGKTDNLSIQAEETKRRRLRKQQGGIGVAVR